MSKLDFMTALDNALSALDQDERKDILADYETHFSEGLSEGLTEEAIIDNLGSVEAIAAGYLNKVVEPEVLLDESSDAFEEASVAVHENTINDSESVHEFETESEVSHEPVFVPYEKQPRSGLAQALILIGLIFFNVTFILGPFIAIWAVWFSLIVSGGAFVFESIRIIIFSSMGTYQAVGLSDITMFSQIGFYLTFGLFLILVDLKFGAFLGSITKKYLNWNSRIVKGV